MWEGYRWRLVDGAGEHEIADPVFSGFGILSGTSTCGMGSSPYGCPLALLLFFACFLDFRLVLRLGLGRANTTRPCRVQAGGLG